MGNAAVLRIDLSTLVGLVLMVVGCLYMDRLLFGRLLFYAGVLDIFLIYVYFWPLMLFLIGLILVFKEEVRAAYMRAWEALSEKPEEKEEKGYIG